MSDKTMKRPPRKEKAFCEKDRFEAVVGESQSVLRH